MFEQMIRAAYEAGEDIKVRMRRIPGSAFVGRVLEVGEDDFLLFHHGRTMGNLWAFRFEDIAACALLTKVAGDVPLPGLLTSHPLGEA